MSEKKNDNQKQLNIAIDETVADGVYSEIKIKDSPNIPLNFGPAGEA